MNSLTFDYKLKYTFYGTRDFSRYQFLGKIETNAQNFYLLKIRLNLFEISNTVLKFKNLI